MDDLITSDEYIDELLEELDYTNSVIDMLLHRLEELGGDTCVCLHCIKEFKHIKEH